MIQNIDITNVLFLDIECVSLTKTIDELSDALRYCWEDKATKLQRNLPEPESAADYYPKSAAIYSEYGKIVCISVGITRREKNGELQMRVKSFYGHDEREIIVEFNKLIESYYNDPNKQFLCGHNIKEFDIPYICRRALVNGLAMPRMLDIAGKKPWETKQLLDTLELWSHGDRKAFTSLKTLCAVFGIPSPKDDIDGSMVGTTYWNEEGGLERIQQYCKKDVIATAQVFLKLQLKPVLEENQIILV